MNGKRAKQLKAEVTLFALHYGAPFKRTYRRMKKLYTRGAHK